jgi:hypothetical protein
MQNVMAAANRGDVITAMGALGAGFVAEFKSKDHGNAWIVKHAENIWAAVEFVFRCRSHHFKTTGGEDAKYANLYTRFLTACFEGTFELPSLISWFSITHTAPHVFKVTALVVCTAKFVAFNKIAPAAVTKFSGSPTGVARITTTVAAMNTLAGEVWFKEFMKFYGKDVEFLQAAADIVMNSKFEYHQGASLYGLKRKTNVEIKNKTYSISEVTSKTINVAAAGQGLIMALTSAVSGNLISGFSLSNAKALEKASKDAPMVTIRVKLIIEASLSEISDASTALAALKSAFPAIDTVVAAKPAEATTTVVSID